MTSLISKYDIEFVKLEIFYTRSCKHVKTGPIELSHFFRDINMNHLIREENTADISTVVQDMNAVLHEMYKLKWQATLN